MDLQLYILTFNCGRTLVDVDRFAAHFFHALPLSSSADGAQAGRRPPELIVLSVQEMAPLAYAFLGGHHLTPYFKALAETVHLAVLNRWKDEEDNNIRYVNIVRENVGMTGLMIFARADVSDQICRIETARVGLGVQQMGNKGAVGARLGWQQKGSERGADSERQGVPGSETIDLAFVAAHLAPMEEAVARRNADWRAMVERLVFNNTTNSNSHSPASVGLFEPNTYLFVAGDFNYRTSDTRPVTGDHLRFPQIGAEGDTQNPTRVDQSLLAGDQLTRERKKGNTFHGLSEAPITFPPTYKYSNAARAAATTTDSSHGRHNKAGTWQWTQYRWPSWCDRILYLETASRPVETGLYDALPLLPTSDHRAVALSVSLPIRRASGLGGGEGAGEEGSGRSIGIGIASAGAGSGIASAGAGSGIAPFPLDPTWEAQLQAARRREVVVGSVAYLGLTREGQMLVLATVLGALGAWFVLSSLTEQLVG
ncbi:hypothetical protein ASPZODRAFT_1543410 [Penicilliopsis zonata CBS 506.65]|uniref:Inositol polyphosphate-related phosphatase domain-containing protein n=1 Tax=Penicilliopsis zonata CBS 506.65 TaxID=1073090 RepID=A0A1L9SLX0_9EURO|nr:hypothetical protein ASPZODRAFT_1543410 [Penicilliopsis zonata CBS 506.65]OJJ48239.1 hypothetical protein ASPZODRAFT_1543410 [Penicilliopsis zonata CBS 506.65]